MDEGRARALLRAERAEVAALLKQTEEAESIDLQAPDSGQDYADGALPLTEQANDAAVADQLQSRLDTIDRALARIEAGSYGRSVLSGKPIPGERLEADPAAELTIEEASAQRLESRGHDARGHDARGHDARGHDTLGHDTMGSRRPRARHHGVTTPRPRPRRLSGPGCGRRACP
jgi:DnaK suppressor protein